MILSLPNNILFCRETEPKFSAEKPAKRNALRFAGFRKNEFVKLRVLVFEFNEAFDKSEQRVVFATANAVARLPFRTALARENVAAENVLAAEFFESEPLCV